MKRIRAMIITGVLFFLLCTAATGQTMTGTPDPDDPAVQSQGTGSATSADSADPATMQNADEATAAMTDIHDIKPLISVPVPVSLATILLWTMVGLFAAAGLLGAWMLWKRRQAAPIETIEAQLSPEDVALQKLTALSLDTMGAKAFYFQLSAIFRKYIQERFGIGSLEMTTEELLPRVETMPLERGLKQAVKTFLASCDPVKFAGAFARRETMEKDLKFVKGFVEITTVPPLTPEDAREPADTGVSE